MTNSYSRAVGGDRAKSSKPCRTEEKYSLIGAISMFGIVAHATRHKFTHAENLDPSAANC